MPLYLEIASLFAFAAGLVLLVLVPVTHLLFGLPWRWLWLPVVLLAVTAVPVSILLREFWSLAHM